MTEAISHSDKHSLRQQCLSRRERMPPGEAKQAALSMAAHLLPLLPPGGIVAGYQPVRGEIDPAEALAQLSVRGHELCLPVVQGAGLPLLFRRWRLGHALSAGKYGIGVPPESEPELHPQVVIVPLVAFDAACHRLGYGAGYYDRTIRRLRETQKSVQIIGAAFECQRVEKLPAEAHDEKLDAVVTEMAVYTPQA